MHSWMTIERLRELLVNLQVLGELEEGYKLNTKEKFLELDNTTWYQSVLRWYRGDSRITTINKVSKTVLDTCAVVEESFFQYKIDPDILIMELQCDIFLKMIAEVMEGALRGLRNLKNTYNADITICAQLEFDIRSFEQKIKDIQRLLEPPSDPRPIRLTPVRRKTESL
jgi:hypothetical protein